MDPTQEQIDAAREAAKGAGTFLGLDWRDSLGDLATDPSLSDFKDIGSLAKSYIHTKKLVGHDKIPIPTDEDEESWNTVFKRLGRPDAPEGYEIGQPAEIPEGFTYNPAIESDFRKEAHKLGLSKKQASGLWNMLNNRAIEVFKNATATHQAAAAKESDALKGEWGQAYDQKLKIVQRTINALEGAGVQGLNEWLTKTGAGKDPMMLRILATIGEHASEEQLGPGKARDTMTPQEAMSLIKSIQQDPANHKNKAYWNKKHPDHKAVVEEVQRLYSFTGDLE